MARASEKKSKLAGGKKPGAKKTKVDSTKSTGRKSAAKRPAVKRTAQRNVSGGEKTSPVYLNESAMAGTRAAVAELQGNEEYMPSGPNGLHDIITDRNEPLIREEIVPSPVAISEEMRIDDGGLSEKPTDYEIAMDGTQSEPVRAAESAPDGEASSTGRINDDGRQRNEAGELQLVCFSLGDEEYGVDIYRIQEINRSAQVTQIPEAPFYVKGIINLRGNVIPILDLRLRLGLEKKEEDKNTRIIVFDHEGKLVGITVDGVTEVLRVPAKDLEDVPNQATTAGGEFLQGIIRQSDRLILVIDCEKILTM